MKLVASLATRGRAAQLLTTLAQHMKCMSRPDTKMIVQCDADDWQTVAALQSAPLDPRVSVNIQPRPDTVAAKWNRGLAEPADVYLNASDDDPYITPDLDEKILAAAQVFPDGIGCVYGHMANASFPGVIAYTAKWAETMGYLQPEYFPYWFADHWTDDVAKMAERIVFADVTTDQSKTGQTIGRREAGWWATWFDAAYLMRRTEASKLIDALESPDWLKQKLRTNYIRVEFYSRWVNDSVRAQSPRWDAILPPGAPETGYVRAKQAAIAMLPHLLNDYGMDKAEAMRFYEALDPPNVIPAMPRAYA